MAKCYSFDAGGFEGSEKKIELRFAPCAEGGISLEDLISRPEWRAILRKASCDILSAVHLDGCTAYLLSESSLFVWRDALLIKTCGRTALLCCLHDILDALTPIRELVHVKYSRSVFLFPSAQPAPHTDFTSEVDYLDSLFANGQSFTLGPTGALCWHVYVAGVEATKDISPSREVVMFELPSNEMAPFYKNAATIDSLRHRVSLIDWDVLDDFVFNPCGYSMNALRSRDGGTPEYLSVHITPEPQHTFVSFDTNANIDCDALLKEITKSFSPRKIALCAVGGPDAASAPLGFQRTFSCFSRVDDALPIACTVFKPTETPGRSRKPLLINPDTSCSPVSCEGNTIGALSSFLPTPKIVDEDHVVHEAIDVRGNGDAFMLVDVGVVHNQLTKWNSIGRSAAVSLEATTSNTVIRTLGCQYIHCSSLDRLSSWDQQCGAIIYCDPVCLVENQVKMLYRANFVVCRSHEEVELVNTWAHHTKVLLDWEALSAGCFESFDYLDQSFAGFSASSSSIIGFRELRDVCLKCSELDSLLLDIRTPVSNIELFQGDIVEHVGTLPIIVELTEYLLTGSLTLVSRVIGDRKTHDGKRFLILNDAIPSFTGVSVASQKCSTLLCTDVYVPSGDGVFQCTLPSELSVGDWVTFSNVNSLSSGVCTAGDYFHFVYSKLTN